MTQKLEKQLKQPDQFVTFWSRAAAGFATRRKSIIAAVLGLFVALVAGFGMKQFLDRGSEDSSRAFTRIHRIATAALIPESGTTPTFDDNLPHFKTDKERQQAALKAADEFLGAHGGSRLADSARLLKARALVAAGRPTEAVALYEELRGRADDRFAFLIEDGLAYAHEESGQIDKAITTLDGLAERSKKAGNFHRDHALFNKARLLQRKGNTKDAEKLLREVLAETPNSPLKDEINDRLAALEAK